MAKTNMETVCIKLSTQEYVDLKYAINVMIAKSEKEEYKKRLQKLIVDIEDVE